MKKLLLFVFLITSSLNLAQSVLVSGAGTEVVNGGYFVEGTYDGVNYYSNGSIYIYRLFGSYWRISTVLGSNMASDMYYTTHSTMSSVPWGRAYYPSTLGSSPAPTLQSYNVENLGSYTFSTQQEIDDFGANYPYDVYLENLYIGNSGSLTDIHDLSPLQNIVGITGNLSILNTSLTNVDGLSG